MQLNDKDYTPVLVEISGLLRNLIIDPDAIEVFIKNNVLYLF